MQIHLNGNDIANREQLHDALSEALELPEWYGRSLDALYDCLTDLSVPTTIHVENWPEIMIKHRFPAINLYSFPKRYKKRPFTVLR